MVHGCGGTHYPSPCVEIYTRCPELSALYPLVEVLYHRPARDDQHAVDLDAGARARPTQHAEQPLAQHRAGGGARAHSGPQPHTPRRAQRERVAQQRRARPRGRG